MPSAPTPSPALVFSTLTAYQRTAALKAAITLELFTAIGEGNATAEAIAGRCKTESRGMRILCDYLVTGGFLTKKTSERAGDPPLYALTPDSAAFLDKHSPMYMGGASRFLGGEVLMRSFDRLVDAVRKGGTVEGDGSVSPEHPMWVEFARGMGPLMMLPAQLMAQLLTPGLPQKARVLDIAAGHGLFGITLAAQNPTLEVVAQDWANVLPVAQENAKARGVEARFRSLPGDAFHVDYGRDYDLVLLTNFLHHFDAPTNEKLLRKVHAALKKRGRVAALEFVPNDDRVTPPGPAQFSLVMLSSTPRGDAYTFPELSAMFSAAGFLPPENHALPPTEETLLIATKA